MKVRVDLTNEFDYYKYLVDVLNLYMKYKSPDKIIRGREIELLCWMAVGSELSLTLNGAPFVDWLKDHGGFTQNDIYRYRSSLLKKGWLLSTLIKITPNGQVKDAKEGDIEAIEGFKFRSPIFDKKRTTQSLEMTLNVNVDANDTKGEGKTGGTNGTASSVPDSTPRAVHSAV